MRERLLLAWDGTTALRRRHRTAWRWLLAAAATAALTATGILGSSVLRWTSTYQPSSKASSAARSALPSAVETRPLPTVVVKPERPSREVTTPRVLEGQELASAWLTGFLTRSHPADKRWVAAVRDLTTKELLLKLEAEGPGVVGLKQLRSWRVTRIVSVAAVDQPADTESREVLSYAATVTDGRTALERPFQLYCYLDNEGRWRVAAIEQPYSSEG